MKVGDLVKAPWLLDHGDSAAPVGIVVEFVEEDPDGLNPEGPGMVRVLWTNGIGRRNPYVFPHLLEVVSEASV